MPNNPLKILRESLNLSREELASGSCITYQRILDTEAGRRSTIPVPVLHFLRDFCRVDSRTLEREFSIWYSARCESIRQEMLSRTDPQGSAEAEGPR